MIQNRCQEKQMSGQGSTSTSSTGAHVSSATLDATDTAHHSSASSGASTDVDAENGSSCAAAEGIASAVDPDDVEPISHRTSDRKGKGVVRWGDQVKSTQPNNSVDASSSHRSTAAFTRTGSIVDKSPLGENQERLGAGSRVVTGSSREGPAEKRVEERDGSVKKEEELDGKKEEEEDMGVVEELECKGEGEGTTSRSCNCAGVGSRSTDVENEDEDEEDTGEECLNEIEPDYERQRQRVEKGKESVAEGKRPMRQVRDQAGQEKDALTPARAVVALTPGIPRLALRGVHTTPKLPAVLATVVNLPALALPTVRLVTLAPTHPATSSPAPTQPAPTQAPASQPLATQPHHPTQRTPAQAAAINATSAFSTYRFMAPVIQPPASRRGIQASHTQSQRQTPGAASSTSITGATAVSATPSATTSNNTVSNAVGAVVAGSGGLSLVQPFNFTFPVAPAAQSALVTAAPAVGALSTAVSAISMVGTTAIGTQAGSNPAPMVTVNRVLQAHQALRADRRQRAHSEWQRNEQFKRQQAQTLQAIIQDQERHRQQQQLQKQEEERERQSRLQAIQQMFADSVRRYQAHGLPQTPFVYPSYVDNMWVHWSPATALAPAKKALLSKHGSTQTSDLRKKQHMLQTTWKKVEVRPSKYPFRPPGQGNPQLQGPRVKKVCAPLKPARRPVQRTGQSTLPTITVLPVVPSIPVMQQPWPSSLPMAKTVCANSPSTPLSFGLAPHPVNPVPQQASATTLQGDTEMQLSAQAAIRMWKYVPLHTDPHEATRLAFLNLCAAHGYAGFTFSGAVLEYGWTHLSQCLPKAGQLGHEVALRNAQTVVDLKRTMSTWKYEPLHPDATTAAALAHMDFDAANKETAGFFGAMLMAMGRQHMDSCVAKPMDWMPSPGATATTTATAPTATTISQSRIQPQTASHSSINLPTRLLSPPTTSLASAPCTLASAPLASTQLASTAPLASALLASPSALAPTHPPHTYMLPLPAHPLSFTPVPRLAAAATIPQIPVSAPTPTANAVASSALSATLVSPAGRLVATPSKPRNTRTLGTLLAPLTPQLSYVPHTSVATDSTPVAQPHSSSAQDYSPGGPSTGFVEDDFATENESQFESLESDSNTEIPKHNHGNSSDTVGSSISDGSVSSESDSSESLTSTSATSDSSEGEGEDDKVFTDTSDSTATRTSEQRAQSRKANLFTSRQRHLRHRVMGSPIFDMVKLGLAKILPKGKRLLKGGLGRCITGLDNLSQGTYGGNSGSDSCGTRNSRHGGVKRMRGRTWQHPYQKENTSLSDFSSGSSDGDSDNSDDSGYHPSPTLLTRKQSNRADVSSRSIVFKSSTSVQPQTAGESSTNKKLKRARSRHCDDNQHDQSNNDDSYDGSDDTDDEQRPCKRRFKHRCDSGTKNDSNHRRSMRGSNLRGRRQRTARKSQQSSDTCTAFNGSLSIVGDLSSEIANTPTASITRISSAVPTKPATAADGLARAVQRLRKVIDAVPKDIEVCTSSDLELERESLLKAAEVVFCNQSRQYNPPGSTDYTPVPTPSNPTRNDTTSYTLPSAETVSYDPDPEAKDANMGATTAADAVHLDFLKAQSYHIKFNLPDRHQPSRSGATSELKTMMDQNTRKRRAATSAEETSSDRRNESLPEEGNDYDESDKPRKLKSRRVEY